MMKPIPTNVKHVIAQIPGWMETKDLIVEPIGGLTNTNYRVTVQGERFVVRISGENTEQLGIHRQFELQALTAAAAIGIGPEVIHFILPEGHLVTRLIEGRHWTVAEYRTPKNLRRIVETVKRLHACPPIEATFSPFRRVEHAISHAKTLNVPFPNDFNILRHKMHVIEAGQQQDSSSWFKFCHNDLFSVNFLDDGTVRIVDWEFAGMGDIYFDLATLVYAYDSEGPLPPELEDYLLACYFGEVNTLHQTRLEGMKYMLLFFTAMWGLVQHGLQTAGIIPVIDDFDCLAYAQATFAEMRQFL